VSVPTPRLSPADAARLSALADVLVPAGSGMPSGGDVGVAGRGIERVLAARPDLVPALARVLDQPGPAREAVDRLARLAPADLAALRTAVLGAYYLDDEVRQRLRYPGQQARPIVEDEEPEVRVLLRPVIQRGRTFREPPR
jgi:hypothetical protein